MIGPRIVLLGMMTKMPQPGVVWQTVQYLEGFRRLGWDPWYVEAHAINPSMFQDDEHDTGSDRAAGFVGGVLGRFGFGDRWCYQALHADGACFGLEESELLALYRDADLIVNLHGGTVPRPEHETGTLVYLETDPVGPQVELANDNDETRRFLATHSAHFTFGELHGQPGCEVPVDLDFVFRPTRQPIVVDWWEGSGASGAALTTIGNWRQRWRTVELEGEPYTWSKDDQFEKVLDLPGRSDAPLELALAGYGRRDRDRLLERGWRVVDADEVAGDIDSYRDYVWSSRGEFTAAKDQNVRLRSGWFSDRSAAYLASGRPVITQDTGFGDLFPTGEGLFAWTDIDDAAAAIEAVLSDPVRHSRAARELAHEFFGAERVLKRFLSAVEE